MDFLIVEFLLLSSILFCYSQVNEDPAVTRFREYLRINTAHPNPDYESGINWLKTQAEEIGLEFRVERYGGQEPRMFAVIMSWNGSDSSLPSILIDSHMDVVAVDSGKWTHPPFEAFKDSEGIIFGRGASDMKSMTVATLESLRRMKASGFVPLRTLHMSVLPDEELFRRGVKKFINSSTLASLNVGFAFDEGVSSPEPDTLYIANKEKSVWQFNITVRGKSAHAFTLPEVTAGQKIQIVIDKLMEFRKTQVDLMKSGSHTLENVTSLNLVKLGGGLGNNIIPDELWASFDLRTVTKPGWGLREVEGMLDEIVGESGNDTTIEYITRGIDFLETPADETNGWWVILQQSCWQLNVSCIPHVPSGLSDGSYIRNTGIPVLGFNPFVSSAFTGHQVDERISESSFLEGIEKLKVVLENFLSAY